MYFIIWVCFVFGSCFAASVWIECWRDNCYECRFEMEAFFEDFCRFKIKKQLYCGQVDSENLFNIVAELLLTSEQIDIELLMISTSVSCFTKCMLPFGIACNVFQSHFNYVLVSLKWKWNLNFSTMETISIAVCRIHNLANKSNASHKKTLPIMCFPIDISLLHFFSMDILFICFLRLPYLLVWWAEGNGITRVSHCGR